MSVDRKKDQRQERTEEWSTIRSSLIWIHPFLLCEHRLICELGVIHQGELLVLF